ncbi:lipopolysaccharide heptosyltransferase I [bacterium]|nr:lipopolysaccharide heptosyltransferase I [bacterium]MCI0601980.1 lipopolysaccharide heptosyltransferase I [bacterium]
MRVLIVRLSSMGDVVHSLPAVTDAARSIQDIQLDWVVDRAFAEIPGWHSSVRNVIGSPPRRLTNLRSPEFKSFFAKLRSCEYDLVIDLQGQWKSAAIARFAKGLSCGYNGNSVNERGADLLYRKQYFVSKQRHSIRRMRELMARALSYTFDENNVNYGIDRSRLPVNPLNLKNPYLVFIHSTSWESKCWPENYWQELTAKAIHAGFHVVLVWGNLAEKERARMIAAERKEAILLDDLSISEKASVLIGAHATVGLDTGLSHIAAALDIPSVTLYGATDPFLVGATGKNQMHIASDFECVKCHRSVCDYSRMPVAKPACFASMTPEVVWSSLEHLIFEKRGSTQVG